MLMDEIKYTGLNYAETLYTVLAKTCLIEYVIFGRNHNFKPSPVLP